MVNVHAPQDDRKKESLLRHILDFKEGNSGQYIIFGDFNVVRFASERIGTIFNSASANVFNYFISDGHLWEIPHGGHLFTRINSCGDKLSKLDRFLITENSTSHMHNYLAQVLDCHISDHRPIVLSASSVDFGPTPFKLYNSWLLDKYLHTIVTDFWEQHVAEFGSNSIVGFKNKMKTLKTIIKEWSRNRISSQAREKEDLVNNLKEFDATTVRGSGNIMADSQRSTWLEYIRNIELKENLDISKKAKVKLGIEADENSKFFHAIVNQKRTLSINGIKHEGQWLSDPHTIKDNAFLVSTVSEAEIRNAIWDCGSDKSPGPDGAKLMVFKIDFENAFDSVSWDYLFQVMCFMGFSEKWITWIKAMEGLHVAVEDAISVGLYRGLTVNTLTLSRFFFADDALFIGEWSRANIKSMASILECFHRVSGLKINFHKSNIAGVGVPFEEVNHFSQIAGCNAMQSSFLYLGLPVDCKMANTKSCDPILDKFSKYLSKWESSLLSIGDRTTLLSSVLGAIGTYHFSLFPMPATVNNTLESLRSNFFWGSDVNGKNILWISWRLVLASKEKEGLAIHGEHGDGSSFYNHVRDQGVWGRIVRSINSMHEKGPVSHSFLRRRASNGALTKFWHETWMGDTSLKNQFSRLFRLALNKDCTISDYWNNGWDLSWSRLITSGTNAHHLSTHRHRGYLDLVFRGEHVAAGYSGERSAETAAKAGGKQRLVASGVVVTSGGFPATSLRLRTSPPASRVSPPFSDPDPGSLVARATAKRRSTLALPSWTTSGDQKKLFFSKLSPARLCSCGYFLECKIDARDSDGHLRSCLTGLGRVGRLRKSRGNGRVASTHRIWVAIWKVKSMAGKLFELADVSGRHKHRLVAMDALFKRRRPLMAMTGMSRILWKNLNGDAVESFRVRDVEGFFAWVGDLIVYDVDQMWNSLSHVIKDATKDAFGVDSETARSRSTRKESW
nr:RNA-directed DNA polymerase, eukaryota, reverse transcriptase zinc-binding domain protein [Tanacetum cinerariifolium]